jgi:hypothetical protein
MQTTVEIHNYQGALRDWKALHCKYSMLPSAPVKIEHSLLITFVSDGTIFETDGINLQNSAGIRRYHGSLYLLVPCGHDHIYFGSIPHRAISTKSIPYNSTNGRHEHLEIYYQ